MIGGGHAIQTALAEALTRHGMDLETAPVETAVESAVAAAPDLILLVGDAARDAGGRILERLSQSPLSRTVPVAILADEPSLGRHLEAFRHGAAAVIRRSASVDEIAERIAGLARQVPEPERIALEGRYAGGPIGGRLRNDCATSCCPPKPVCRMHSAFASC